MTLCFVALLGRLLQTAYPYQKTISHQLFVTNATSGTSVVVPHHHSRHSRHSRTDWRGVSDAICSPAMAVEQASILWL